MQLCTTHVRSGSERYKRELELACIATIERFREFRRRFFLKSETELSSFALTLQSAISELFYAIPLLFFYIFNHEKYFLLFWSRGCYNVFKYIDNCSTRPRISDTQ